MKRVVIVIGLLALAFSVPRAAEEQSTVVTPAMLGRTKTGAVAFALERTSVDAEIVGVMSQVRVKQTFRNPLKMAVEAVYIFPLPAHAAVHSMVMRVGERRIVADVRKRAEAREKYEHARDEGKTAALLEEERENVFTQSVANILQGDLIEVELAYTQELVPTDGEYEFVFPTVVMPRYAGTDHGADKLSPPLLAGGMRPGHDVTVHMWIDAGVPIEDLHSPTHEVAIKMPQPGSAMVDLKPADRIPNRDFSVRYRLAGQHTQAAALAAVDAHGGHLLLMLQPQVDLRSAQAAAREYTFVLDVSGSMDGEPHARSKTAMALLLHDLRPTDFVQVILFESGVQSAWSTAQPATKANVKYALQFVDTSTAGGGTEVLPALKAAVEAKRAPGLAREIVLMTDGGISSEDLVLEYLRAHNKGLNVFSFGVGAAVNRAFIDALARIGHGEPFILLPDDDERAVTKRLFQLMSRPSLTDVSIDWGGLPVHDMTPAHPPDLFADRPIVVAAKIDQLDQAAQHAGTITVRGLLAGKPYEEKVALVVPKTQTQDASLAYLWARRRITELTDEHPTAASARTKLEAQVTELGLAYHLITPYTSFVAIDERVRTHDASTRVEQPVPLPQGVTESAAEAQRFYGNLSAYSVRPGDPELQIFAPVGTKRVSVVLPHGETKLLRWDGARERWSTSFLLPDDMRQGVYVLTIVIELPHETVVRRMRMRVDEHAPDVALALDKSIVVPNERVTLTAHGTELGALLEPLPGDIGDHKFAARVRDDAEELVAIAPDGSLVRLDPTGPAGDRRFTTTLIAPSLPGHYVIAVLARDGARNGGRATIELEVR